MEQVHLGVTEGSRIPYIGRRLSFLVRSQREAGRQGGRAPGCVASPLGSQLVPELRGGPEGRLCSEAKVKLRPGLPAGMGCAQGLLSGDQLREGLTKPTG